MNNKVTYWLTVFVLLTSVTACQRSGNNVENKELMVDNKLSDTIKKLDSLSGIHWINNDSLSMAYARIALKLAQSHSSENQLIIAWHAMGKAYYMTHKDSSFYYYKKALALAEKLRSTVNMPSLLYNIAELNIDAGNYKDALVLFDSSIQCAKQTKNFRIISDGYNAIGSLYLNIQDSLNAKISFNEAFRIGQQYSLPKQTGNALSNLAVFEKDNKQVIILQKKAIELIRKQIGTEGEIASSNINISSEEPNSDSAIVYCFKALAEAKVGKLPFIEIAAYNNLAYSYLEKGDNKMAINCIVEHAIPLAEKINQLHWLSILYDSYTDILTATGDTENALKSLKKSVDYQKQFNLKKNDEQVRLLSAILDLRNKETTIKEKETEIETKGIQNQRLKLILAVTLLVIIIIIFIYFGYRQRTKLKFHSQQINSAKRIIELEETEKRRIGFELHDNLGYLMKASSGLINSIAFEDNKVKEQVIEKMKELSDCVRRISHRINLMKDDQANLHDLIPDIINDMITFTGIDVTYFIPKHLPEFTQEMKLHTCRIVQELLTNASKYAQSSNIRIDLALVGDNFLILYEDDGPGFDQVESKSTSIGIKSIYERISLLGGKVEMHSIPGKGTKWEISIPK